MPLSLRIYLLLYISSICLFEIQYNLGGDVQRFEEAVIEMLKPKIKSVLRQTDTQNREDLEQELILMVLATIKKKIFSSYHPFLN